MKDKEKEKERKREDRILTWASVGSTAGIVLMLLGEAIDILLVERIPWLMASGGFLCLLGFAALMWVAYERKH